jgi:WD40 repeat protein
VRTLAGHAGAVRALAFSCDGRLASGGADRTVRLWDVEAGREAGVLLGHTTAVTTLAFSPDSRRLASGDGDGVVKLWDPAPAEAVRLIAAPPPGPRARRGTALPVLSPDGGELAIAVTRSADAASLGLAGGGAASWLCRSRRAFDLGGVRLCDALTGEKRLTVAGHRRDVQALAYSPDGRLLATAGSYDGLLIVWDAANGRRLSDLQTGLKEVTALGFSPDGALLAAVGDGEARRACRVRVWDWKTGGLQLDEGGPAALVSHLAFSGNGGQLAVGTREATPGGVQVWRPGRGGTWTADGGGPVAFQPDGVRVVGSGGDGRLRLWSARTGEEALAFAGGGLAAGFSADGRRLLSLAEAGGADGGQEYVATLWDAAGGQELLSLRVRAAFGVQPRVLPGALRVAFVGRDGVSLWDWLPPPRNQAAAAR